MRRAAAGALRTVLSSRSTPAHPRPAPRPAALLGPRPFSSTAPTSFFFRKPTKSAHDIARELVQARRDDRPDLVAKLYPSFVDAVAESSSSSSSSSSSRSPLSRGQFQDLMRFAATTGKSRLALRMFNDAPVRFGFHHSLEDHQILLMALARVGRLDKAIAWLESMHATHGLAPTASEWNVVVQGYRREGDLDGMHAVVERMRSRGVEPNIVTYNTLIAALFEHGNLDGVRRAVADLRERGIEHDLWTEQTLLAGFLKAGELASARDVQRRLRALVVNSVAPDASGKGKAAVDQGVVNGLVQFEAVEHGFDAGVQLAGEMRARNLPIGARTLSTLVQYGVSELGSADEAAALLDRLEDALGVEPDRHAWSTVIAALARRPAGAGGLDEALRAYQVARDRSVQPDSLMVQPLLSALLLPSPTPDTLVAARELYDDLATSSRSFTTAHDASVYVTLLRACADPAHPDLEWSRSLIGDMKQRGIRLDGASTTWHIVALMRAATSFDEAFAAYDEMRALDPSVLDRKDYNTILSAFTALTFPSSTSSSSDSAAPAPLIMEFMTDMRTSGHPPSSATYALLLTYYSRAASASPATIAHLHSLIKLDVHLDPDTPLFNALMGAYSRTGAYNAAYRIWDAMLLHRGGGDPTEAGIDAVSVSTLLDTAAHDGSPAAQRRAERVWDDLARGTLAGGRVRRTPKNWDAWVEALGRWGRLAEAEQVVFGEMAPGERREVGERRAHVIGDEAPVAGEGTVRALLKFAARDSAEAQQRVAQRVRDERPDLWPAVEKLALRKRWTSEEAAAGEAVEQSEEERRGFFSSAATTKVDERN